MIHLAPAVLHLIQVAAPNAVSPFQFVSNYIHLVAWPTICLVLWKASKAVTKFTDRVEKTTGQIDAMATNHFPHMEQYLLEIKTILAERK
jgi:hypothetical protein